MYSVVKHSLWEEFVEKREVRHRIGMWPDCHVVPTKQPDLFNVTAAKALVILRWCGKPTT